MIKYEVGRIVSNTAGLTIELHCHCQMSSLSLDWAEIRLTRLIWRSRSVTVVGLN